MTEETSALYKALANFQRNMHNVHKGETAKVQSAKGSFSYTYADIAAVIDAVKEPLAENGLCYLQVVTNIDGAPALKTILAHQDGASIEGTVPLRFDNISDPQKFGGVLTYVRRYALLGILGLATDDDDAQSVGSPQPARQHQAQQPTPRQSPQNPPANAPGPSQRVEHIEDMTWTEMWNLIRPYGISNRNELEQRIGQSIDNMTPGEVFARYRDISQRNGMTTPAQNGNGAKPRGTLTDNQLNAIRKMLPKKGLDEKAWNSWACYTLDIDSNTPPRPEDLSKQQASTVIEQLGEMPDNPAMQAILEASGR